MRAIGRDRGAGRGRSSALLALVACVVLVAGCVQSAVLAAPGGATPTTSPTATPAPTLSAFGTARIDGAMSAGEWDRAARVDLEAVLPAADGGARVPAAIFVMNDATMLYLGASLAAIPGCTYNPIFEFDNDDDGYLDEVGNDWIAAHLPRSASGEVELLDQFMYPVGNVGLDTFTRSDYPPAGTIDGKAAGSHPGGTTTWVEMSHPIDSADDLHDFSLSVGETVGFVFDAHTYGTGCGNCTGPECHGETLVPADGIGHIRIAAQPASPSPSAPADPFVGKVVVTVTDDLVVRSQPRVATDSVIYTPYLPRGTELKVIGGPVKASGYTWYEVVPVSFVLDGRPASGWVAAAGKDGAPWIALRGTTTGKDGVAISTVPRAKADPKAAKAAAASINAFGLDLYKRLLADETLDPRKGAVISPTSIAFALGLALAGAKGDTAAQMATVLHTAGWDPFGQGLNSLDQALASRDATWKEEDGRTHGLAIQIANAAFAQSGWPIETAYLDRIAAALGVGLRLVDFIGHRTVALKTINAWVSAATKKRIPALLEPTDLDKLTRLVLVNAMYLKAEWEQGYWDGPLFRTELTQRAAFTRLDGSRVQVQTMEAFGGPIVPYAKGNGWRAVELRYKGSARGRTVPLAMTLVMPDHLAAFERSLTASQLGRIIAGLTAQRRYLATEVFPNGQAPKPGDAEVCPWYPYAVDLRLPRFGTDGRADLADALKALGMPLAFDLAADFSGITQAGLTIAKVIHQANIDVDEKGTEAAAATAVLGITTGGCGAMQPVKTITVRFDHPFLFFVRDIDTGAILFMGRVVDPSKR